MKVKYLLVTGMSFILHSAFVQAYSQEEVNQVELSQEEMAQTPGAKGQRRVPEVVVKSGMTDNKSAVPGAGEKVPGSLSTTQHVTAP